MIIIETIILMVLFTAVVLFNSKNPLDTVYDVPQPIIDRCLELGLIDEKKKADSLYFVNGAENFLQGFLVSYIIWLVIDWYDCIVIDWCWCFRYVLLQACWYRLFIFCNNLLHIRILKLILRQSRRKITVGSMDISKIEPATLLLLYSIYCVSGCNAA